MEIKTNESTEKSVPYFDRNTTAVIKGIALIMMFMHHFFTFPSWWCKGIQYPLLEKLAPYFSTPLKLCVPVFCFITGYFYYFSKKKTLRYSLRKITDILIDYWLVFIILAVINIAVMRYSYSVQEILLELFALQRATMFFCWYVFFYCVSMLILPFLTRHMERKGVHWNLFLSCLVVPILVYGMVFILKAVLGEGILSELAKDFVFFPSILIGYIFARFDLFQKMETLGKKWCRSELLHVLVWIVAAVCAAMGRYLIPRLQIQIGELPGLSGVDGLPISLDVVYAPLFIYCIVNISRYVQISFVSKVLAGIGKQSLLMWFMHCIFFNQAKQVFQRVLYFPHNPVLVLIWGLLLCYAASAILDLGLSRIIALKNKKLFK